MTGDFLHLSIIAWASQALICRTGIGTVNILADLGKRRVQNFFFMCENCVTKRQQNIGAWRCGKDIFTNHESVSHLIDDEAVCRTAPATPGLLNTLLY